LEEIALCVGPKVLIEVADNILLIVGDPQWILHHQLRPRPINLMKSNVLLFNVIELYVIKMKKNMTITSKGGNPFKNSSSESC